LNTLFTGQKFLESIEERLGLIEPPTDADPQESIEENLIEPGLYEQPTDADPQQSTSSHQDGTITTTSEEDLEDSVSTLASGEDLEDSVSTLASSDHEYSESCLERISV
jgi:hypothetical protein